MKYRFALPLLLVILFLSSCGGDDPSEYRRFQTQRLGYFDSFVLFIGYARCEAQFAGYADKVFDRLGALHRLYDIFTPHEKGVGLYDINRNAGIAPLAVPDEVIALLLAGREAYTFTEGAVNIALGPVLRIWHAYRQYAAQHPERAALPSMEALYAAAALSDIQHMEIDTANNTVLLAKPGMSLDVGAIAKGFAAGLAMETAAEAGLNNALLNLGGHVITLGAPPGRDNWEIYLRGYGAVAYSGAALSVSAADERFFTVDGRRYGHVIDPATLMPAARHTQTAVLHRCSWRADVLSTALFILPPEAGLRIAADAEGVWIDGVLHRKEQP